MGKGRVARCGSETEQKERIEVGASRHANEHEKFRLYLAQLVLSRRSHPMLDSKRFKA